MIQLIVFVMKYYVIQSMETFFFFSSISYFSLFQQEKTEGKKEKERDGGRRFPKDILWLIDDNQGEKEKEEKEIKEW